MRDQKEDAEVTQRLIIPEVSRKRGRGWLTELMILEVSLTRLILGSSGAAVWLSVRPLKSSDH